MSLILFSAKDYQYFPLDVDECTYGVHSCDSTRANCKNTDGSYECVCKPGYIGNGSTCILFGTILSMRLVGYNTPQAQAGYLEYIYNVLVRNVAQVHTALMHACTVKKKGLF